MNFEAKKKEQEEAKKHHKLFFSRNVQENKIKKFRGKKFQQKKRRTETDKLRKTLCSFAFRLVFAVLLLASMFE